MVELIKKKVIGATILEPLVAVVIISGVITMSSMIFGNIVSGDVSYLRFRGLNKVDQLMISSDFTEDEDFTYESYVIEKSIEQYKDLSDVVEVCWVVRARKDQEIILRKCFLLND